ncbi:MAG: peptidylprolyl isomerase [Leptospiraceae bacterium]|nr:peptidylprolyl isomerase [Leptospiraceae bacterium]
MFPIRMNKFALVLFSAALLLFCQKEESAANENQGSHEEGQRMSEIAVIKTRLGTIKIKFFPDLAPKHVDSFLKLAREGFYNGTTFHRVIPGFMIQGGDPNSKDPNNRAMHGTGGPGYSIPAEFSNKAHTRGIVSAARSQDPNSAGSQFFICVADAPHLNGQYTVFGEVIEGMDVVDKIVAEERDNRDNPITPVAMEITVE